MEKRTYTPIGVCSDKIYFTLHAGKVVHVEIINGCEGNLQGIASLVEGMEVDEVIRRLWHRLHGEGHFMS